MPLSWWTSDPVLKAPGLRDVENQAATGNQAAKLPTPLANNETPTPGQAEATSAVAGTSTTSQNGIATLSWWQWPINQNTLDGPGQDSNKVQTDSTQNAAASWWPFQETEAQSAFLSWIPWPFGAPAAGDSESETENKADAEVFREARQHIETARETCHYAICSTFDSPLLELAVHGTKSATCPVKCNPHKKPQLIHELFESSLTTVPAPAPVSSSLQQPASSTNETPPVAKGVTIPDQAKDPQLGISGLARPAAEAASSPEPVFEEQLLPALDSNFRVVTLRTKLRLWGEALFHGKKTSEAHIYRATPRNIAQKKKRHTKKAVVITMHSFLPRKLVKFAIGQNTGSASLFATKAGNAISAWALAEGNADIEIKTIALEGVGPMKSRNRHSLELLQNWKDTILDADFLFVVLGSVSSPAAVFLLHHLLTRNEFDLLNTKVGLLSMGGTFLGPYVGIDAKIVRRAYTQVENDIIRDLADLQQPQSELGKAIRDSFGVLCRLNVKLLLVGALEDTFVPLHSAAGHFARHPNIYKAVHVSKASDVPQFVVKLIAMILTMENVGFQDQVLLQDLLEYVQGLLTDKTRDTLINSDKVYEMGVRFCMETTSLWWTRSPTAVRGGPSGLEGEQKLYHLPWNVRGLLHDLLQVKHIGSMRLCRELVAEYGNWEPSVRDWKELKLCFAAFDEIAAEDLMV